MPTLKQYAREAIYRLGTELGRVEPVTSLTSTSVTCSTLARLDSGGDYQRNYLVRRDTASVADRVRTVDVFTGSNGALSIPTGNSYADTTSTDEYVEIIKHDPYLLDMSINTTVGRLSRLDFVEFPSYKGVQYWLDDLTWLNSFADLKGYKVTRRDSPQLTRNRYFDKWNVVNADTAATTNAPDHWTISGSNATLHRSTTNALRGRYTCVITRAGTDCSLRQSVGTNSSGSPRSLLSDGTSSLAGETVSAFARVKAGASSQVKLKITDGVTTSETSYFTSGTLEGKELTHTVSASATEVTVFISVETSNSAVYVDECFASFGSGISNTLYQDSFAETVENARYSTGEGGLVLYIGGASFGAQYRVYTRRPYTKFSESRILAGTADADSIDAPLVPVATGAIGRMFEQLATDAESTSAQKYAALASIWNTRFDKLAEQSLLSEQPAGSGIQAMPRRFRSRVSRFGGL